MHINANPTFKVTAISCNDSSGIGNIHPPPPKQMIARLQTNIIYYGSRKPPQNLTTIHMGYISI